MPKNHGLYVTVPYRFLSWCMFLFVEAKEYIKNKNTFCPFRLVSNRCYTFSGAGQADSTVTSQGHRVGVHWVDVWLAVGQFYSDQAGLIVSTNPLVGLNVGRVQNRLLEKQSDNKLHFLSQQR